MKTAVTVASSTLRHSKTHRARAEANRKPRFRITFVRGYGSAKP